MVRTITALLLIALVVSAAGAVRVTTPVKPHGRATTGKSTPHTVHRTSHAAPRHATSSVHRTVTRGKHPVKKSTTVKRASAKQPRSLARPSRSGTAPTSSPQMRPTPETAAPAAMLPSTEASVGVGPAPDLSAPLDQESGPPATAASANLLDTPVQDERMAVLFPGSDVEIHKLGKYALRGTHDSLVRQNERNEAADLERIEDDADLADRIARGMLVPVPESVGLSVNPSLPVDRRYCRPWTASFLTDLARAHEAEFHSPLIVSSAVRTVEYQRHLMRRNHNAAAAEGDIVSPHLTGATIDIAKSGLRRRELAWMRDRLLLLQNQGLIDVEEEFRQACFHITVYKDYAPDSPVQQSGPATTKLTPNTDTPPAGIDTPSDIQ
jgi:Family of unknown function (DUF5715)